MMINRHNYEEFFLLYADDELNHQQRAEVELFVAQNPDMAAELEILQQMKLQPEDNIVFPDKSTLFKTTDVEININNYEEFFLLYIDKELSGPANEKVEKFVLQHPQLQEEFTLLKQTILQPEAIVFADKSVLYKKEERKVGYLRFTRIAAAAAFIGLLLTGWLLYPKTGNKGARDTVGVDKTKAKAVTPPVAPTQQTIVPPTAIQSQKDATAGAGVVKKHNKVILPAPVAKDNNVAQQQPAVTSVKDNNSIADNNPAKSFATTTTIVTSPVVATDNSITTTANLAGTQSGDNSNTMPKQADINAIKKQEADIVAVNNPKAKNIAQPVAYKEIDINEDDDRSMYVGSLELNKDKVKGFLKKAGRLFGSKSKKDTD